MREFVISDTIDNAESTKWIGGMPITGEVVRCKECKHYIPEKSWEEERAPGMYETMWEPPECKRWSFEFIDSEGKLAVYRPDVEPNGFCYQAEKDE